MHNDFSSPLAWLQYIAERIQWPVIVYSAFWLGRRVERLETRIISAETHIKSLIERHLPHVHRALADLKGKLDTIQALVSKGNK
jgi:hypothetical protein